jgi:hypothetical protein
MADTIREFLVTLAYDKQVDPQQQKLIGQIEIAATKAVIMANAILEGVRKIAEALSTTAEDFAALGFMAQRVGATATEIKSFEEAFTQMGLSKGDADAVINSLHAAFSEPARAAVLKQMGIDSKDPVKAAQELGRVLNGLNPVAQAWLRGVAGVSLAQAEALQRADQLAARMKEATESSERSGITDKLVEEEKQFYITLTDVKDKVGNIFAGALLHFTAESMSAPLEQLDKWLLEHQEELAKSLTSIGDDFEDLFDAIGGATGLQKLADTLNFIAGGGAGQASRDAIASHDVSGETDPHAPGVLDAIKGFVSGIMNRGSMPPVGDMPVEGGAEDSLEVDDSQVSSVNRVPIAVDGKPGDAGDAGGGNWLGTIGRLFGGGGGGGGGGGASPVGSADGADLGAPSPPGPQSAAYGDLRFKSPESTAGGQADQALIDLAHNLQNTDPQFRMITALNDAYHVNRDGTPGPFRQGSDHIRGRAMDVAMRDGDYEGARQRERARLLAMGLKEAPSDSAMNAGNGDFWIEPGTGDHMHVSIGPNASARIETALGLGGHAQEANLAVASSPTLAVSIKGVKDPRAAAQIVVDHVKDANSASEKFFKGAIGAGSWDR